MEFGSVNTAINNNFYRLRWSVFEEVSNIRIVEDLDSPNPELLPFLGHRIRGELATKVPLREIPCCISFLMGSETPDYERPETLTVHRADGGAVTIRDVVEQLSAYFVANKDIILEDKAPFLHTTTDKAEDRTNVLSIPALRSYDISDDTRVFFDGFARDVEVGDDSVNVDLWAEGQFGESIGYFWKNRPSEDTLSVTV
jgi:hypothetical protein